MGKKSKNASGLGRSIIKDRFKDKRKSGTRAGTWLHQSELNDGYEWGRLNLNSVTEESKLDEFLAVADLAGTEFTAERLNMKVLDPDDNGLPSAAEISAIQQAKEENKEFITIPRRPQWDSTTSAEELALRERDSFLQWRRRLAVLQEKDHVLLTPFERNLDFWRQLWRVIERSDVVVQIVDARNPMLFRCEDLELYVKEVDPTKENLILVNKSDLLTEEQRQSWADYFTRIGVRVLFWSAVMETERLKALKQEERDDEDDGADNDSDDDDGDSDDDDDDDDDDIDEDAEDDLPSILDTAAGQADSIDTCPQVLERDAVDVLSGNIVAESGSANLPSNELSEKSQTCQQETVKGEQNKNKGNDTESCEGAVGMSRLDISGEQNTVTDSNIHEQRTPENATQDSENIQGSVNPVEENINEQQKDKRSVHFNLSADSGGNTNKTNSASVEVTKSEPVQNTTKLYGGEELLEMFKTIHTGKKVKEGETTIGLVGYPNVGKSSTINALLHSKKVPVSATPGRTKHFQTLYVEPTLCLCDCPGLVMPSLVSTKAEMVVNGILRIDELKDHVAPVSLVCQRIPRHVLERIYGITIVKPREGEDPNRSPSAHELLMAYGYIRGYMTARGVPDAPRSARYVLKDYVKGKLMFCHAPPGMDEKLFQNFSKFEETDQDEDSDGKQKKSHNPTVITEEGIRRKLQSGQSDVDAAFFSNHKVQAHSRGVQGVAGYVRRTHHIQHVSEPRGQGDMAQGSESGSMYGSLSSVIGKPWKKHNNKNKKEKLRRVHRHLDEC